MAPAVGVGRAVVIEAAVVASRAVAVLDSPPNGHAVVPMLLAAALSATARRPHLV